MSDTPPAGAGSDADPVEEPAPSSSVSSEPTPPKPAEADDSATHDATDDDARERASMEHPGEYHNGVGSAGDSANGAFVWPPAGSPASAVSETEPTQPIAVGAPSDDSLRSEATPYRGFGVEQEGWQPGTRPETPEGPPPQPTGWAAFWPWGLHGILETVEVLALALLMFLLVRSVAQNFVVDGGSMQPTFHDGEMLIVNKLAYRTFDLSWLPFTDKDNWRPFGTPQPGDVVVFKFPQDQTRDFIKRVVAVPGQTVEVQDGHVYIDGVQQNEPYLDQAPTYDYGPTTVPEGEIFVLGDNRNNSYDSHSWGLLDQSLLIGRAEFRYWPMGRIGRVGHGGLSAAPGVTISPTEAATSSSTTR